MSYQVIARKYRPQSFPDVVGQEHVTRTLSQAIAQKRIAHAYIFCGPRGTGKTTVARIFAKCLNATDGPRVDFAPEDPRAVEIAEGRSLDVFEIDGASNNGVEQVRELRETCKYAPSSSRFKIYIIDEVHMLSTAAFNALLKTLEEPPEHVKFLFATTDPEKVLPTILSRCQRFDLRRIPVSLIAQHLAQIAKNEGVTVEQAALTAIARGAEGAMRDAESTLDQLISFCGKEITEPDVLSMFGLAAQAQVLELAQAILEGQVEPALRHVNELAGHGKDLGRLLSDLLNHFRNLLIYQVSRGDLSMLEVAEAEAAALAEQTKLASQDALTRILDVLADAEMRFRDATSKKILIEVALLKAIEARNAMSLDSVLQRLQNLRGSSQGGAAGGNIPAVEAPAKAAPIPPRSSQAAAASIPRTAEAPQSAGSQPPAQSPADVGNSTTELKEPATPAPAGAGHLDSLWKELLDAVGRARPLVRSYLKAAHPVRLEKTVFVIGLDPEFSDEMVLLEDPHNLSLIQMKLKELGHPNLQVKIIKSEVPLEYRFTPEPEAAATPVSAPVRSAVTPTPIPVRKAALAPKPAAAPEKEKTASVPFNKDDFKNDPLIQKALEVFKGQIVQVRA